jgi:N-acetylglucosaminylphosphatidylinositol deacetylase
MPIRRPGLYVVLALVPALFSLLFQPLRSGEIFPDGPNIGHSSPPRILLITAHPDDEAFFFGPTLTSLIPPSAVPESTSLNDNISGSISPQVYFLCLSVGNADGLGDIRRLELGNSLDVLGVAKTKRWVLDKPYAGDILSCPTQATHITKVSSRTTSMQDGMQVS